MAEITIYRQESEPLILEEKREIFSSPARHNDRRGLRLAVRDEIVPTTQAGCDWIPCSSFPLAPIARRTPGKMFLQLYNT